MAIHPWKEALDIWSLCQGEGFSLKSFGVERSWMPISSTRYIGTMGCCIFIHYYDYRALPALLTTSYTGRSECFMKKAYVWNAAKILWEADGKIENRNARRLDNFGDLFICMSVSVRRNLPRIFSPCAHNTVKLAQWPMKLHLNVT